MEIVGAFITTGALTALNNHVHPGSPHSDNDPCLHQVLQVLLVNFWSNTISSLWDFSPPGLPSFTNQPGPDMDHLNLKSSPKHLQISFILAVLPLFTHKIPPERAQSPTSSMPAPYNWVQLFWPSLITPKVSNLNWVLGHANCFSFFPLCLSTPAYYNPV